MKKMVRGFICTALLFGLFSLPGCSAREKSRVNPVIVTAPPSETETPAVKELDLDSIFHGINGCAVLYIPETEEYSFYKEAMCKKEISPYSTFKIITALSGLQNGVLKDENSRMTYDGTIYDNADWNKELTLKEAFQKSCIWYFKQVIECIGKPEIEEELNSLNYGNGDISEWNGSGINPSEELNGFWLESSLKISPLGQIKVLAEIFEGKSIYDTDDVQIVRDIMLVKETEAQKVYGKTGSGAGGKAWFVGFFEQGEERNYFAVYLDDPEKEKEISGSRAKEIAIEIVKRQK